MSCKGICIRYKAPRPPSHIGGRYGIGQKRCQVCGLFIEWKDLRCPCCHYRLRTKPHNPVSKKRILVAMKDVGGNIEMRRMKKEEQLQEIQKIRGR